MKVSQISQTTFGITKLLKKPTEDIIQNLRHTSITTTKVINRNSLQKHSTLCNLNYEDWDFDGWNNSRNDSDDNYF